MSSLSNLPCNLNPLLKLTPPHFADIYYLHYLQVHNMAFGV
jgi:hypothetical protein